MQLHNQSKVKYCLAIFDRANSIDPAELGPGPAFNARAWVEPFASNQSLYEELQCNWCATWHWQRLCSCQFQKLIAEYSSLPMKKRDSSPLPNDLLIRFSLPNFILMQLIEVMDEELSLNVPHLGNQIERTDQIQQIGMREYDERAASCFEPDLRQFEQILRASASSHPSLSHEQGKVPPEIYEFLKRKRADFFAQLSYLSNFLVALRIESAGQSDDPSHWAELVDNRWIPMAPAPQLISEELTPRAAEEYVARIIRFFGEEETEVTRFSQDGGYDVISKHLVVQVKHQVSPVGAQVVREILGVATSLGRRAAVFARGKFTKSAKLFAEENEVILFQYLPDLVPHSESAGRVMDGGLAAELGVGDSD